MRLLFLMSLAWLLSSCSIASSAPLIPTPTAVASPVVDPREEAQVRAIVQVFGKKLGMVSLQAPNAQDQVREQYAEFVSPELVETWTRDMSRAPGRVVSSPWPDRIEIASITRQAPGRYVVDGFIAMVTSVEMVKGGAFEKVPVHLTVQNVQGKWVVTEYKDR